MEFQNSPVRSFFIIIPLAKYCYICYVSSPSFGNGCDVVSDTITFDTCFLPQQNLVHLLLLLLHLLIKIPTYTIGGGSGRNSSCNLSGIKLSRMLSFPYRYNMCEIVSSPHILDAVTVSSLQLRTNHIYHQK